MDIVVTQAKRFRQIVNAIDAEYLTLVPRRDRIYFYAIGSTGPIFAMVWATAINFEEISVGLRVKDLQSALHGVKGYFEIEINRDVKITSKEKVVTIRTFKPDIVKIPEFNPDVDVTIESKALERIAKLFDTFIEFAVDDQFTIGGFNTKVIMKANIKNKVKIQFDAKDIQKIVKNAKGISELVRIAYTYDKAVFQYGRFDGIDFYVIKP